MNFNTVYRFRLCVAGVLLVAVGCGSKPVLDPAATKFVEAKAAIENGDTETAISLLTESIDLRPDPWAYYERGRLYAEEGEDDAANEDIAAGLEMDPEHSDLLWLQKQVKKPKQSRFKGRAGTPPQASK